MTLSFHRSARTLLILLCWATAGALSSIPSVPSQQQPTHFLDVLEAVPAFPESTRPSRIKCDKAGNVYVLSSQDHAIAIYDANGRFVRRIGCIGMGPAEFQYPWDFDLGRDGRIYVADRGNGRVQILGPTGTQVRQFPFPDPHSIAVLSDGRILVVGRQKGQLINTYSTTGEYLGTCGVPIKTDVKRPELEACLNEGRVLVDDSDYIYYLFEALLVPTVRIYNSKCAAVSEVRIHGADLLPFIERAKAFIEEKERTNTLGSFRLLSGIAIDPSTGHLYVSAAGGTIHVHNRSGNKIRELRLKDASSHKYLNVGDVAFWNGKLFGVTLNGCYVADISGLKEGVRR